MKYINYYKFSPEVAANVKYDELFYKPAPVPKYMTLLDRSKAGIWGFT